MKYINYFVFVLSIIFFTVSCSDDSNILSTTNEIKFKMIAYKSLTDQQKESLTIQWQDAFVEQGYYQTGNCPDIVVINSNNKLCFNLEDGNTQLQLNQKLVAVSFGTKDVILLGPMIVIIDPTNENVIGFVGRN